jgi:hypothetical protein
MLREIEHLVALAVEVKIPFMNPITYVSTHYLLSVIRISDDPVLSAATMHSHTRMVSTTSSRG